MASRIKSPTLESTFNRIAKLLSPSFRIMEKETKAITKRLAERSAEFKEAEKRVERNLRSGVRKTKGDVI